MSNHTLISPIKCTPRHTASPTNRRAITVQNSKSGLTWYGPFHLAEAVEPYQGIPDSIIFNENAAWRYIGLVNLLPPINPLMCPKLLWMHKGMIERLFL